MVTYCKFLIQNVHFVSNLTVYIPVCTNGLTHMASVANPADEPMLALYRQRYMVKTKGTRCRRIIIDLRG